MSAAAERLPEDRNTPLPESGERVHAPPSSVEAELAALESGWDDESTAVAPAKMPPVSGKRVVAEPVMLNELGIPLAPGTKKRKGLTPPAPRVSAAVSNSPLAVPPPPGQVVAPAVEGAPTRLRSSSRARHRHEQQIDRVRAATVGRPSIESPGSAEPLPSFPFEPDTETPSLVLEVMEEHWQPDPQTTVAFYEKKIGDWTESLKALPESPELFEERSRLEGKINKARAIVNKTKAEQARQEAAADIAFALKGVEVKQREAKEYEEAIKAELRKHPVEERRDERAAKLDKLRGMFDDEESLKSPKVRATIERLEKEVAEDAPLFIDELSRQRITRLEQSAREANEAAEQFVVEREAAAEREQVAGVDASIAAMALVGLASVAIESPPRPGEGAREAPQASPEAASQASQGGVTANEGLGADSSVEGGTPSGVSPGEKGKKGKRVGAFHWKNILTGGFWAIGFAIEKFWKNAYEFSMNPEKYVANWKSKGERMMQKLMGEDKEQK